jgi:hypothetical protein
VGIESPGDRTGWAVDGDVSSYSGGSSHPLAERRS